eukprot:1838944-Pleurochrysis_carterae.AAC.1
MKARPFSALRKRSVDSCKQQQHLLTNVGESKSQADIQDLDFVEYKHRAVQWGCNVARIHEIAFAQRLVFLGRDDWVLQRVPVTMRGSDSVWRVQRRRRGEGGDEGICRGSSGDFVKEGTPR